MMHLEAIQRRNAEACENAPRHRAGHIHNAMEWTRRALVNDPPAGSSQGVMMDAAHAEYQKAGGVRFSDHWRG